MIAEHRMMETQIMIVMLVTMGLAMGEVQQGEMKVTKETILEMKEMMLGLKSRLAKVDQKLKETKEDMLKVENEDMMENDVSILGDAPYLHQCGFHTRASFVDSILSYECLFYDVTNQASGLSWETGVFSCPYPGTYTITWSISSEDGTDDPAVEIYLRKNEGGRDMSSFHQSYFRQDESLGQVGLVEETGMLLLILIISDSVYTRRKDSVGRAGCWGYSGPVLYQLWC